MRIKKLRVVVFFFQLIWMLILFALLVYKLHSYGPTVDDPDPDGYLSYAYSLAETSSIQPHRRLVGYPYIISTIAHDELYHLISTTNKDFSRIDTKNNSLKAVAS
jgi:hypothetical protein